jgi:hypothetical protein
MKKIALLTLLVGLMMSSVSGNAQTSNDKKKTVSAANDMIEVYYFHYTRRCLTCNAVEDVTKNTLAELYPEQSKQGKIKFTSVNLDEKSSKTLAQKCKADGQALIITGKGKRADLTQSGFMNARSKPEALKEEIKKTIDPLL